MSNNPAVDSDIRASARIIRRGRGMQLGAREKSHPLVALAVVFLGGNAPRFGDDFVDGSDGVLRLLGESLGNGRAQRHTCVAMESVTQLLRVLTAATADESGADAAQVVAALAGVAAATGEADGAADQRDDAAGDGGNHPANSRDERL